MGHAPATAPQPLNSPPKAPLVFRIGVVGHRPDRLKSADLALLQTRLKEIINAVQAQVAAHHSVHRDLYGEGSHVVRALSPLAEGADRLFAHQALEADCELTVVTPFARDEFRQDFAQEPDSLAEFDALLAKAKTIFELDGQRDDAPRAYHVAGDVVLNQSDLLIVVWDGERKNKRGGTEQTLDDAVERGVPIVWIDAHSPHHWKLVTRPLRWMDEVKPGVRAELTKSAAIGNIQQQVDRLLSLHRPEASPHNPLPPAADPLRQLETYYQERRPEWHIGIFWKWFRNLIAQGRVLPPACTIRPYEDQLLDDAEWPQRRDRPVDAVIDALRPYYAWADKTADLFADAYRSAFVASYFLAAVSVAMALAAVGLQLPSHSTGELIFAGLELAMIGTILFLVFRGRRAHWHRRWLDYRLLAEMIRHQRLVAYLGGQRASPQVPEHLTSYGDPGASWMAWYARAVERSLGLPTAVVDADYLHRSLDDLKFVLDKQVEFHTTTQHRSEQIEHRLHWLEVGLLTLTLIGCFLHVAQGFWHAWPQFPSHGLTFFSGFFPALGAALAGICNQAEFRRIAQRSRSMRDYLQKAVDGLETLRSRLKSSAPAIQLSPDIAQAANAAAQTMVNEVLDWRVIFQDRPLRTT